MVALDSFLAKSTIVGIFVIFDNTNLQISLYPPLTLIPATLHTLGHWLGLLVKEFSHKLLDFLQPTLELFNPWIPFPTWRFLIGQSQATGD
jgi:hypothetical protein